MTQLYLLRREKRHIRNSIRYKFVVIVQHFVSRTNNGAGIRTQRRASFSLYLPTQLRLSFVFFRRETRRNLRYRQECVFILDAALFSHPKAPCYTLHPTPNSPSPNTLSIPFLPFSPHHPSSSSLQPSTSIHTLIHVSPASLHASSHYLPPSSLCPLAFPDPSPLPPTRRLTLPSSPDPSYLIPPALTTHFQFSSLENYSLDSHKLRAMRDPRPASPKHNIDASPSPHSLSHVEVKGRK